MGVFSFLFLPVSALPRERRRRRQMSHSGEREITGFELKRGSGAPMLSHDARHGRVSSPPRCALILLAHSCHAGEEGEEASALSGRYRHYMTTRRDVIDVSCRDVYLCASLSNNSCIRSVLSHRLPI